jgi:hypothetical protein
MPNINAPSGFVPRKTLTGASWNGAVNRYYVPSTNTDMISVGDAVKSATGGDANGVPAVQKALGTDAVRGVVVGVSVAGDSTSLNGVTLDLSQQNIPAAKTKDYYVFVVDDPNVVFSIQDDGLSALTASACNKNATFTVVNPTSPRQNSASVLSTASVANTATLNLRIMGLDVVPGNTYGAYARWLVKFNLHELANGTAGV